MIDHYDPHIVTAQDYYPFGMLSRVALPNNGKAYKFGFNGKLNDNEVKGLGNQQDYGMRIYDPRVGKFLSVDPLTSKYPELTPYQFASNTPNWAVDLDGAEGALYGPGMTLSTFEKSAQGARDVNDFLNEPAPLWMKRTLASQVNYVSSGVELTEDDYKGLTRGQFYLKSAAHSLSRWAQSSPGNLKIPNTRLPQQPDVEIPTNTTRPRQGVTVSEEVPTATNRQVSPNGEMTLVSGNKVKVTNADGSNFGIKNINPLKSITNCSYCVIATDHYLKTGYPVVALNTEPLSTAVLEKHFGANFTFGMTINQVEKWLISQVKWELWLDIEARMTVMYLML